MYTTVAQPGYGRASSVVDGPLLILMCYAQRLLTIENRPLTDESLRTIPFRVEYVLAPFPG